MAKLQKSSSSSKKNGIVSLKVAMEKLLQRSLMLKKRSSSRKYNITRSNDEDVFDSNYVPEDVKEGHFAVLAMDDEDDEQRPQRFVVPLTYLSNPAFVKLLERAAEEYGFDREGALTVPCSPTALERILLEEHTSRNNNSSHWGDSSRNMIKSCEKHHAVFV